MTINEIREIVISPDAIMKKEHGKILLDEIDRLTEELETENTYSELERNYRMAADEEIKKLKERAEKAEKQLNKITQDERFSSMFPNF